MLKSSLHLSSRVLAVAALPTAALAQDAPPPAPAAERSDQLGVGEIVVTAERREQNLQKAPLTIQVLGGELLERTGVTDAAGLQRLATGLEIGQGGGNTQIFIRGVGGAAFSPLSSPGVAFNVDGVYVGRPNGVNGNFYDVARIEVLKGPQGTLYGRNANGGSINLITNAPRLDASTLDLSAEGGNYDYLRVTGAVNLPVGENAAVRGAFNIVHRDGFLSDGANDDIQQAGRLRFLWKPHTDLSLQLSADYAHQGGRGGDYVYLPQRPGSSPYEAQSEPAANAYLRDFSPLGAPTDTVRPDSRQNTTLLNLSAQLDWQLGDFATLTVLPAYRRVHARYVTHFAGRFTGDERTEQGSLEVRLGNSTPDLTWVIGAYGFDERAPGSVNDIYVSDILQNYHIVYSPKTRAYAVFGQATIPLADGFRVIAGGRYTHERRSLTGTINNAATTPQTLLEEFGGRKEFGGFSYRVGAEFDLSPDSMVFLTYSTGFKAGGFSQTVAPLNVFQPERLKSLEFGSRNRFFDNRLQLNFGAFHWRYTDIQDQRVNFDPLGNVNFITFNSGDATLYGGNVDIVARPTRADTISLTGEYTHSRYDQFTFQVPVPFYQPAATGCRVTGPYAPGTALPDGGVAGGPLPSFLGDCSGFQVARVPKWSGTLTMSHVFDLGENGSLTLDGSVKYASARWLSIDFNPAERDGAYAVLDANLTYVDASKRWSIGIFGRNLTKTVYYTGGIQTAFIGGLVAANIAPPRTYGVRASLNFD